jgi:hypothetical protein
MSLSEIVAILVPLWTVSIILVCKYVTDKEEK